MPVEILKDSSLLTLGLAWVYHTLCHFQAFFF